MSDMTDDEKVLCVRARLVSGILDADASNDDKLQTLLASTTYRWRRSPNDDGPAVEEDERFKQLIPYIVVVNKDGQILAHNRGKDGGEEELKNKWAIGFGGHVNDQDTTFQTGIIREIREELSGSHVDVLGWDCLEDDDDGKAGLIYGPVGFINDDSNDVGRKHLGVVYVLRADEVVPREVKEWMWVGSHDPEWLSECGVLESWSVLALPMVREFLKGGAN